MPSLTSMFRWCACCSLAGGLGLAFTLDQGLVSASRASAPAPLTATYRTNETPQSEGAPPAWRYTRPDSAGARSEAGESDAHRDLIAFVARACEPGGVLQPTRAVADAFEYSFGLYVPVEPSVAGGITEVWWSADLELPLVIVRESGGRTIVDELVRLELQARDEGFAAPGR